MPTLRDKAVRYLAKHVEEIISKQNDRGEFFPDAYFKQQWNTDYQQFAYYPLAYLYTLDHAENPWKGNARVFEAVRRSLENNVAILMPDGRTMYSSHDHTPGPHGNNWRNFTWLRTWELLRSALDPKLEQACRIGLERTLPSQVKTAEENINEKGFCQNHNVRNHPVWHLLATLALGRAFGKEKEAAWAAGELEKIAACQHPAGCWFEHNGPVSVYQHITVNGLGHYQALTGSEPMRAALHKALEFKRLFTYPNGHPVETVDGRTRYLGAVMSIPCATWAETAQGRATLHLLLDRLLEQPLGNGYTVHSGWLGLPFFTQFARDLPAAEPQEKLPAALPGDGVHQAPGLPVQVLRKGPWTVVLSAFTRPEAPQQRWMLDYQTHLSVFHEKSGLIIGGGGGKRQAHWSLFHGAHREFGLPTLATRGRVETTGPSAARMSLDYPGFSATVNAAIEDDAVNLGVNVERAGGSAAGPVFLQLPFLLKGEGLVTTGTGTKHGLDIQDEILAKELGDSIGRENRFKISGLKDAHALLHILPYNTHWRDGRSAPEKAMGIVAQPLAFGTAHAVKVTV
jgi:hypothetical protein